MIINQIQNPGQIRVYTAGLYYQAWHDAYYADPAAVAASGGNPDAESVSTSINSFTISTKVKIAAAIIDAFTSGKVTLNDVDIEE